MEETNVSGPHVYFREGEKGRPLQTGNGKCQLKTYSHAVTDIGTI